MNWWDTIQSHGVEGSEDRLVRCDHFLGALIQPGAVFRLNGIGGVGDPLLDHALDRAMEISKQLGRGEDNPVNVHLHAPLGAIDLDGAVAVVLEDPNDDLRSMCAWLVVLPGAKLRTQTPSIPVVVQRSDSSAWDEPGLNQEEAPKMIDLVSTHTKQILISFGTVYGDELYPCARFEHHPHEMDMAAVESAHEALDQFTPSQQRARPSSRL